MTKLYAIIKKTLSLIVTFRSEKTVTKVVCNHLEMVTLIVMSRSEKMHCRDATTTLQGNTDMKVFVNLNEQ